MSSKTLVRTGNGAYVVSTLDPFPRKWGRCWFGNGPFPGKGCDVASEFWSGTGKGVDVASTLHPFPRKRVQCCFGNGAIFWKGDDVVSEIASEIGKGVDVGSEFWSGIGKRGDVVRKFGRNGKRGKGIDGYMS